MQKIGSLLPDLFNEIGIEDAVKLKFLRKKWFDIFSGPISVHTYARELKAGKLIIIVDSHAWLNELKLMTEPFLAKLSPFGVENIEFKFGKIRRNEIISGNKFFESKISSSQQQWINEIMERVKDEEVRLSLENAIKKQFFYLNEKFKGESI